jgi:serine/threonine-protein kinase
MWPVAILVATVIVAIVAAVVLIAALGHTNSNPPATASQTSTPTYPADSATATYTSTYAPPVDPEAAAYQQLQTLKDADASALAQVTERWIPQLSSKHATQPWTPDPEDGLTYDSVLTLQEHQRLRQQYGAILAWSGDWNVWVGSDYWITVVPQTFSTSEGVLNWCNSNNLDRDHCSAQIVSKTQGQNGTHAYNR